MKEITKKVSSQERDFLNFRKPLITGGLLLMKNVLTLLAKSILAQLGLTAATSATDAAIQKKKKKKNELGTTTLVFSNEDLNDIIKIVKSLEESFLLIKGVSATVENEVKEQKDRFLGMLAAMLPASLLGSALTGKDVVRGGDDFIQASEGTNRASQDF